VTNAAARIQLWTLACMVCPQRSNERCLSGADARAHDEPLDRKAPQHTRPRRGMGELNTVNGPGRDRRGGTNPKRTNPNTHAK